MFNSYGLCTFRSVYELRISLIMLDTAEAPDPLIQVPLYSNGFSACNFNCGLHIYLYHNEYYKNVSKLCSFFFWLLFHTGYYATTQNQLILLTIRGIMRTATRKISSFLQSVQLYTTPSLLENVLTHIIDRIRAQIREQISLRGCYIYSPHLGAFIHLNIFMSPDLVTIWLILVPEIS